MTRKPRIVFPAPLTVALGIFKSHIARNCERPMPSGCFSLYSICFLERAQRAVNNCPWRAALYVRTRHLQQFTLQQRISSACAYIYKMIRVFERTGIGQEFFFRLGLSIGFSKLGFLVQIASFERRLRGAAPMPLALPYLFRTWPGSGIWGLSKTSGKLPKNCIFGRYSRAFGCIRTSAASAERDHFQN